MCAEAGSDRIRFSSAEALTVHADQNLIVLALINLIRNALQAIEGQADAIVSVEALEADGRVYITITDNGPGISPELLSAIFTPFFSTKSGGSGIGLSISHRIMRLHGVLEYDFLDFFNNQVERLGFYMAAYSHNVSFSVTSY